MPSTVALTLLCAGPLVLQAYLWDIHNMNFFRVTMVAAGVFQSTGWPSVVAIMANWFGKGKRGLVMGVWNAHTSLGNILGTVIAAACLQYGWGYAFIVPGLLICVMGLIVFGFLVVQPSDVGLGGGGSYEQVKSDEVRGRRQVAARAHPQHRVGQSTADWFVAARLAAQCHHSPWREARWHTGPSFLKGCFSLFGDSPDLFLQPSCPEFCQSCLLTTS
jgi:sugar phosphate permease